MHTTQPWRCLAVPVLCAALTACGSAAPVTALAAAEGTSVAVFGRGIVDLAVSAISGRDCSIVRLDKRETYCAPVDPPNPAPFCTRSLGVVDCWDPVVAAAMQRPGVGDTPPPNLAQEKYRAARWPKSLTYE